MEDNKTNPDMSSATRPPIKDEGAESQQPSTSEVDFGSGSNVCRQDFLGVREAVLTERRMVEAVKTMAFTNYASEPMVTSDLSSPQWTPIPGASVPFGEVEASTGYTNIAGGRRMSKMARPVRMSRGQNILVPFGAYTFLSRITEAVTDPAALATATTDTMERLTGSILSGGSLREVRNWRRINDLKNTVVSYFNRSIPFTDLSTSVRFAIEMAYTRDLGLVLLPFLAMANVYGYYDWATGHNLQFRNRDLLNAYDPDIQGIFVQIYSAIKGLPVVDEVFFDRLTHLSRLHTSAEESGMWGTIITQDVAIAPMHLLQINGKQGGYDYTTDLPNISSFLSTSVSTLIPTQVAGWEHLITSGQKTDLVAHLSAILSIAEGLQSRYSILLGAAMQLAQKGSVKYHYVDEYVPATGIDILHLKFVSATPVFDYAYKERFEYAPQEAIVEVGSDNVRVSSVLATLPLASTILYDSSQQWKFRRPVGRYHGNDAWDISECIEIGMFKGSGAINAGSISSPAQFYLRLYRDVSPAITITSITDVGVLTPGLWIDAYYGDCYAILDNSPYVRNTGNGFRTANSVLPIIWFYGVGGPYLPALREILLSDFGANPAALDFHAPTATAEFLLPYFTSAQMQGLGAPLLTQAMSYLLNQMDITNILLATRQAAGTTDVVMYLDSAYRQEIWDDFDIALVDNVLYTSSFNLAIPLARKNTAKQLAGAEA